MDGELYIQTEPRGTKFVLLAINSRQGSCVKVQLLNRPLQKIIFQLFVFKLNA